mmetsp:Transcript_7101/g.29337  ORF Transcript_7101/g.29337 Transcript_7101/m.29337 type:complete len:214 (+) Transcript_7101:381-1022(+)
MSPPPRKRRLRRLASPPSPRRAPRLWPRCFARRSRRGGGSRRASGKTPALRSFSTNTRRARSGSRRMTRRTPTRPPCGSPRRYPPTLGSRTCASTCSPSWWRSRPGGAPALRRMTSRSCARTSCSSAGSSCRTPRRATRARPRSSTSTCSARASPPTCAWLRRRCTATATAPSPRLRRRSIRKPRETRATRRTTRRRRRTSTRWRRESSRRRW